MPRARSISGLVLQLAAVYARRHPRWCAAGCLTATALALALAWPHAPSVPRGLATAVLRNGFAVDQPTGAGHRVIELDRDGTARSTTLLAHTSDLRIVGGRTHTLVGWQEGVAVRLARVDRLDEYTSWGKRVRHLCAGLASNDARFGIAWLESDDTVWVVHGPVAQSGAADTTTAVPLVAPGELAGVEWCGVASAENHIALLWRTSERLGFTFCTARKCSGLVANVRFDRKLTVIGVGCLDGGCLIASRDSAGAIRLDRLAESGRPRWNKPLDAAGDSVSVLGLRAQVFLVGIASARGAEVLRFERDGSSRSIWQDPAGTTAPALSWSSGRLLVAYTRSHELVHRTIALPR